MKLFIKKYLLPNSALSCSLLKGYSPRQWGVNVSGHKSSQVSLFSLIQNEENWSPTKRKENMRLDKLKSEMACRERSVTGFLVIYEHTVARQRYKMFYIPHLPQGWWKRIGVSNLVCWVNIGVWRSSSKEEGDWRGKMAQTESLFFHIDRRGLHHSRALRSSCFLKNFL